MKKCSYCTGEIVDEAKKCKHCGEWIVDNKSKGKKWFKWILLTIIILIVLVLTFLGIRKYKQKEFNRELLNNYYDKQISATGETAILNAFDLMDNYIPGTSTEKRIMSELFSIITEFSSKLSSFSTDSFFIEDKDLHNTYRINTAIEELEEYKNAINDYVSKLKNLINELIAEYGAPDEIGEYSIFDVLDKMEIFASQEEKFVNKAIEYYNYMLTIQDKFYYNENEDQIYFSSNGPLNKANTLRQEFYDIILETADVEDEFNNYITEYFKYRKNLSN